jgi:hypothetical protein
LEKLLTVDNLKNISLAGLLLFILYAGSSGWWVYAKDHEAMKTNLEKQLTTALAEREEWRKIAVDGLLITKTISPARVPIMASPSMNDPKTMTPQDIQAQFKLLKTLNSSEGGESDEP